MKIRPKKWGEFQHYKDRDPGWIKLHKRLLNDLQFHRLSDKAGKLLPLLWLIASEREDAVVDADPDFLGFRLRLKPDDVKACVAEIMGAGFFTPAAEGENEKFADHGMGQHRHVPTAVKVAVTVRDSGKCRICGSTERLEYDHIVPVSRGGKATEDNIQLLCRPCNRRKRSHLASEHAEQHATQGLGMRSLEKEVEKEKEIETEKETPLVPLARDGGRPGNERRQQAIVILEFLNGKARRHFRPVAANLKFIEARLAEGVSLQDLKTLTVRKCREWLGSDMEKFLRPETLFNATKCQSYLGEIEPEEPAGGLSCNALPAIEASSPTPNPAAADGPLPIGPEPPSALH